LPKTHFAKRNHNPVFTLLWGKAQIEHASAAYYFKKGNRVQKLMHQLKYKGKEELGVELGILMGNELHNSEIYKGIDYVIPVPLHPSKKRLRGYNQCDSIAQGLAEALNIEVDAEGIKRSRFNTTQTRKSHYERHKNVEGLFEVSRPEKYSQKTVLLVDDVITTGSTLASMARKLNEVTDCKVLVSTLAVAV
jgi:ComF family protein